MDKCYLCDSVLSADNVSKEHILLNSIGGRLKSNKLLCKDCNSKFGHNADSELASQLSFLSGFLQVKRDKGEHPIIKGGKTENGEEYHLKDGTKPIMAKPKFDKYEVNGEVKYHIAARNERELIDILTGLRKKHPELDIEAAKQHFNWREEYLDEPISYNTTIGGDLAFKSIVKTAINYYIHTQQDIEQVKHLFDYLKDKVELKIGKHFYPEKPIYKKESNEIVHLIHLVGNKHTKLLYCYIEFFSAYSFLVVLSDNYTNKNFSSTYCFDIFKGQEIQKEVKLKLDREKVDEIYKLTKDDFLTITNKLDRVMRIAMKMQADKEISNIIHKSVERVFQKHKDEKLVTEQMISELSNDLAHSYVKFAFRGQGQKHRK